MSNSHQLPHLAYVVCIRKPATAVIPERRWSPLYSPLQVSPSRSSIGSTTCECKIIHLNQ